MAEREQRARTGRERGGPVPARAEASVAPPMSLSAVSLAHRAVAGGAPLPPAAVLQLQRQLGNRAVAGLLGGAVQRAKTAQERSEKQRRVAGAAVEIPRLAGKMKPALKKHLFDAKPIDKEINPAAPQGLHAYRDGALPDNVIEVAVEGSRGQVHKLTWQHQATGPTKDSTMFPDWMPESHAAALCVLRYPKDKKVVSEDVELGELTIPKSDLETHILHGQDITLAKSGETVYPTM